MTNLADMSESFSDRENGGFPAMVRAAQVRSCFYLLLWLITLELWIKGPLIDPFSTDLNAFKLKKITTENSSASRKETATKPLLAARSGKCIFMIIPQIR